MSFEFDRDFEIELSDFRMKERTIAYRIWELGFGGSIESRPVMVKGILYFGAADYNIYAVDSKTGKEIWRFKTGGTFVNTSPLIIDNVLYISNYEGYLYAIDINSRKLIWRFKVGDKCWASPSYHEGI
ncbi:MAG: PQQ-binding-like beta-propeller repeat protein, partial [Candidatus Aenigmarchaeota archaeon]